MIHIERLRFLELVRQRSQAAAPRVVLVIGGPGSGKSVLAGDLLAGLELPAARIDLRRASAGWQDTPAAWASTAPGAIPPFDQPGPPFVAAIDNLHLALSPDGVPDRALGAFLARLLDDPRCTLILSSLSFPALPQLVQLAINGEMVVIDGRLLAFDADECRDLWVAQRGAAPSEHVIAELLEATSGWASLVALACNLGWPSDPQLAQMAVEAQISALPDDWQQALLLLAPSRTLGVPQINAATGRSDGDRLLRMWRQAGLLLTDEPALLLPHLRDTLLQTLGRDPARLRMVVAELSAIAFQQGQPGLAVQMGQDTAQWQVLHDLLISQGERLRDTGSAADLVRWLELVRPHSFSPDAELLLVRSQAAMGDFTGALLTSDTILAGNPAPEHIRAMHLIQANIEQARGDINAADELVRPYLHDNRLEPMDRARALRIHGIAQSTRGNDDAALLSLEESSALARGGGPSRLLAMAFGDCGNAAARLGRYILAERYLELAQRTWIALGSPPDIAVVLNMRAVVMLHTNRLDEAAAQAEESYTRALAGDRRRGAAAALATRGDIAVVQGDWTTADLRYRAAVDLAHTTRNTSVMLYAQALRTFAATALGDSASLTSLLDAVSQAPAEAPLDNAWMVVAQVACRLGLRLNGGLPALAEARKGLGPHSSLVHGLLTLLAAAAAWVNGEPAQAAAEWRALDELLLEGRGGVPMLLGPIARLYPAVLNAAYHQWHSPSAQRFLAAQTALPAVEPRLTARLLGQIQLVWQGQPVTLPRHGPELLALLLLAGPEGMTAELMRSRLWGEDEETTSRWNKMLQRVRKALPECISFENGRYRLGVPPHELDADLLRVYSTPLADSDEADLRQAAAYAALPLLPASDQPWVLGERERISRRGAELWLVVGALDQDRQRTDAAIAAYQTAVRLHPLHERATMALISARLERGERADAIAAYLAYRQLLNESLGLDPAPDLELLYQRALHASA